DLLTVDRAALLRGAGELLAGAVAGAEGTLDHAADATGAHGRELLLSIVVAQEPQALKGLAAVALALDGLLDEAAPQDPFAFDSPLQDRRLLTRVGPQLEGEGPVADERLQLLV